MTGIRNVTNDLRPSLLDDLGLLPALRSMVADYNERRGMDVSLDAATVLPVLSDEAEVALFRALQEALANVARHAPGSPARVRIAACDGAVTLSIGDDGPGFAADDTLLRAEADGHLGLSGMRERITALGGEVSVRAAPGRGAHIEIRVPLADGEER